MEYPYIINKEILGGEPVFRNSRVPVRILFDYLEAGKTINDFFEDYPSVENKFVLKLLDISLRKLENNYPQICSRQMKILIDECLPVSLKNYLSFDKNEIQ